MFSNLSVDPALAKKKNRLKILKKSDENNDFETCPQENINQLINLYNEKKFLLVIKYAQALSKRYPKSFTIWNILAISKSKIQLFDEAIEAYKKVLLINPNYAEAYNNMGNAFTNQGKFDKAIETYKKALLINPHYPEALNNIGTVLKKQGKLNNSLEYYKKAIEFKANYVNAYYNMGNVLSDLGEFEEAIRIFKKGLSLKPNFAEIYNNMGNIFHHQGKLNEAIETFKKAILYKSNYLEAYINLGVALKDKGLFQKAIDIFNFVLSIKPDSAETHINLGNIFHDKGKLDNAIKAYNKALSINPNFAEANKNLSFSLLSSGKIKEGLDKYEWRWKTKNMLSQLRHLPQPLWDGQESLKGKRILIWSEQGIGDTLNWVSRLPLITSQADHTILECQEKLVPLLERSFPNIEVKSEDRSLDSNRNDFDIHLPMGSIYKYLIEEILKNPKVDPYLIPDPIRVNFWKERLHSLGKGPYVGISWKSSVVSDYRSLHYPPITEWAPILTIPDITFINLQYVDFADDLVRIKDEFGVTVHNFEDLDQYNDIDDLAAFSAALDMVVSTKVTPPIITSGVGTLTSIANWRQSTFNNVLTNPVSSTLEMFNKDTDEPWNGVFNLIAEQVFKLKKGKL